jgi:hypothetical protein
MVGHGLADFPLTAQGTNGGGDVRNAPGAEGARSPDGRPAEALAVARSLLQLRPKKIWIEDENGRLHTDYDGILRL